LGDAHAEIVLTGVHIGSYGKDRDRGTLGSLVERLVREVPRVRFRLSSIEATEVEDQLAELMIQEPRQLAPHLHAPLQSGSDRILKRMGRHWYTARRYRERIERLTGRAVVFGLGADIMVGFPGETGADHRATVEMVNALPFTYLHVFPYSERPGTAAPRLGAAADPRVAAHRSEELRAIVQCKRAAFEARRDGTTADVVITGRTNGNYEGLTEDYLSVQLSTESPAEGRLDGRLRVVENGMRAEVLDPRSLVLGTTSTRDQTEGLRPKA
jgi:threonylcarbamoyladenosine tRNA methylthiotransferase MtaB